MSWIKHLITAAALSVSLMASAGDSGKVNINTATAAELAKLNGVGQVKAEAIIQHREQAGGFRQLDELTQVKGIGQGVLEKNRDKLTLE